MTVTSVTANKVQTAIATASARTGVDFSYLLGQAKIESGLNANARATTSSASGLYQFIESSWLAVVKKHGAEHGLGWAADAISGSGRNVHVSDPAARSAILALRNDPSAASLMAAEHASDNKDAIESTLGRSATGTDLYMAHFLGLGGAKKFLSTMESSPGTSGAALFPQAARANHGVFYASNGAPRTLSEIYSRFADKLGDASDSAATAKANLSFAAQALKMGDATVVTGNNESAEDAMKWAASLGRQPQTASLMRPTPETARLAYMMLASMGN